MKIIPLKPIAAILFLFGSTHAYSAVTVYGLESAQHFKSNANDTFYIQAASYKNKSNAYQYQRLLRHRTSQDVIVTKRDEYYCVVIGPLHSDQEVRATSQQVIANSQVVEPDQSDTTQMATPTNVAAVTYHAQENSRACSASSWRHDKTWHPVLAIGGGASITSHVGRSQNFPIQNPMDDEFYNYSANRASQTAGLYNGFLGVEWAVHPNWLVQAGFDYNQTSSLHAKGILTEGASVQSEDVYSYHYNVTTRQLLLEGKLLYTFKKHYHPYVLAGVGAAFNQASSYSTSAPSFLTFTRMYQPGNTTSFSYAAGLGVDADLTDNLRIGIGYRFADLGKVTLGSANIDTSSVSGTLSQSNLYASQVIAQLILVI